MLANTVKRQNQARYQNLERGGYKDLKTTTRTREKTNRDTYYIFTVTNEGETSRLTMGNTSELSYERKIQIETEVEMDGYTDETLHLDTCTS